MILTASKKILEQEIKDVYLEINHSIKADEIKTDVSLSCREAIHSGVVNFISLKNTGVAFNYELYHHGLNIIYSNIFHSKYFEHPVIDYLKNKMAFQKQLNLLNESPLDMNLKSASTLWNADLITNEDTVLKYVFFDYTQYLSKIYYEDFIVGYFFDNVVILNPVFFKLPWEIYAQCMAVVLIEKIRGIEIYEDSNLSMLSNMFEFYHMINRINNWIDERRYIIKVGEISCKPLEYFKCINMMRHIVKKSRNVLTSTIASMKNVVENRSMKMISIFKKLSDEYDVEYISNKNMFEIKDVYLYKFKYTCYDTNKVSEYISKYIPTGYIKCCQIYEEDGNIKVSIKGVHSNVSPFHGEYFINDINILENYFNKILVYRDPDTDETDYDDIYISDLVEALYLKYKTVVENPELTGDEKKEKCVDIFNTVFSRSTNSEDDSHLRVCLGTFKKNKSFTIQNVYDIISNLVFIPMYDTDMWEQFGNLLSCSQNNTEFIETCVWENDLND